MNDFLSKRAKRVQPSKTLAANQAAKNLKLEGHDVISLAVGELGFQPPEHIIQAGINALNGGFHNYHPTPGMLNLREAASMRFKEDNGLIFEPNQILFGNGGKECLALAILAVVNPGDEVLIPKPYWTSYTEMVRMAGGIPVSVECNRNLQIDLQDLKRKMTSRTKLFIWNRVSNPTGVVQQSSVEVAELLVDHDWVLCISDEIYEGLLYDDEPSISLGTLSFSIKERLLTANGLSKRYAMTGHRIGYLGAPLWWVNAIKTLKSHLNSGINSIAQHMAVAALTGQQDFITDWLPQLEENRQLVMEALGKMGLSYVEPKGAFYIFPDVSSTGLMGKEFAEKLLKEQFVSVTSGDAFGMPANVRISFAPKAEVLEKSLSRMAKMVNSL